MRVLTSLLFATALALPALAQTSSVLPPPSSTPTASLIRINVTEKLTPHVWAIPDGSAPGVPNVGIVVGTRGVLVVDTGMGARNAQTIMSEVAKVPGTAGKQLYIVTTHFHPEHDLAAHAFPAGSKMIRSKDEEADIAKYGLATANTFASRSPVNAELLKDVTFRKADISFDKNYVLDLGDVKVQLVSVGPNHTFGDTAIFVEGDKVLFSGDVAMKNLPAFATADSSLNHWLIALDRLDAFKPVHVVPSHGPRGDASYISGYRTFLTKVRNEVAPLKKAGKSQDETVAAVTEKLGGEYDKARMAGAIRNAWTEAK